MDSNFKFSQSLDASDKLAGFRDKFVINDPGTIYMDGNSLGRLNFSTQTVMEKLINEEWGNRLIQGWNEGWYEMPSRLGQKLAPLIGAKGNEVIFCDTTSQNLFKLIWGSLQYQNKRTKIISDVFNFPSDIYLLQGVRKLFQNKHELVLSGTGEGPEPGYDELFNLIDENTALVCLSHVLFKSAYMYDVQKITEHAHNKGAMVIWDLSHSVGAVPVELNKWNVDMAVGCSYKYLNGGPGAPAFLFVREDLQEKIESPVWGWFGEENPFEFQINYRPGKGMKKYLTGTPQIISLSAIEPAIDIIISAGIDKIREKSIAQTEYLIQLVQDLLYPYGFSLGSPLNINNRGSHVSVKHPEAYRISRAMIDKESGDYSVIPDFREPDNLRLGITPLYTSFKEVYLAIKLIENIVKHKLYKKYDISRNTVT